MFNTGDFAFDSVAGANVQVLERIEMWGYTSGRIGMYQDIKLLTEQNKLSNMVRRFLSDGFDVYISADHGNTACVGLGRI